jgi:hypothetical protein
LIKNLKIKNKYHFLLSYKILKFIDFRIRYLNNNISLIDYDNYVKKLKIPFKHLIIFKNVLFNITDLKNLYSIIASKIIEYKILNLKKY